MSSYTIDPIITHELNLAIQNISGNSRLTNVIIAARITIRLTALALILVAGCASAKEWTCSRLNETGLKEKLEYLKGEQAALDGKCIAYAILQIAYSTEDLSQAIDTLVPYLDFLYPGLRPGDVINHRITWLGDRYPAVAALSAIGKPAEPSLTHAVGRGANSNMIRHHALLVLETIYSENKAGLVAALTRASRAAPDTETSTRLFEAARQAINFCSDKMKCESELVARSE